VVLGVDSREQNGAYRVYQYTGDPGRTVAADLDTIDWIRQAQDRGAGEVVLNCMNQDGVRSGYDNVQLQQVRQHCLVPLIASGGAGTMQHFADTFRIAGVDGALAASVFHGAEIDIRDLKQFLATEDIDIRIV
jgi:cyclase